MLFEMWLCDDSGIVVWSLLFWLIQCLLNSGKDNDGDPILMNFDFCDDICVSSTNS